MDTGETVGVVVAAVMALIAVGVLVWAGRRQRDAKRRAEAERLREQVRSEDVAVRHRESIATETEARTRAAQAEAEAKAAEAARLQHAAEGHRAQASSSREELDKWRAHIDSLDPPRADSAGEPDRVTQPDR